MSSVAVPVENIPGIVKAIPGRGRKPFAFPPESLFAFSPESRSSSPRNAFRDHPGILFAFARNPQHIAHLRKKLDPESVLPRYIITDPGVGYRLKINH